MTEAESGNEPGYVLGGALIAVLVILQACAFLFDVPAGVEKSPAAALGGIYLQFWGLMFLAAYYFRHKTFFFRGLMWVCEHSNPRGRGMAFFYFGLCFILGTIALARALQVLRRSSTNGGLGCSGATPCGG